MSNFISTVSLADLDAIRLLLLGNSVIDWHYLSLTQPEEVDRFLRVNEFDPRHPEDIARLERLRSEANEYLIRHLDYRIPREIATEVPAKELFILASKRDRYQRYACMILKVMHVMHHLEGREILFKLPVSNDQVFGLVENKVLQVVEEIRAAGHPIIEFSWSRKEYSSLITKLLAKRESIAAHVYDKLRFRLIVRDRTDLGPLLNEMLHRLIPFNYVIPGQTVNSILPFDEVVSASPWGDAYLAPMQKESARSEQTLGSTVNTFSGSGYKVLNFIADLPIRVGAVLEQMKSPLGVSSGFDPRAVIFVLTEFQLIDLETETKNEQDENSHRAYKERQISLVKARLNPEK